MYIKALTRATRLESVYLSDYVLCVVTWACISPVLSCSLQLVSHALGLLRMCLEITADTLQVTDARTHARTHIHTQSYFWQSSFIKGSVSFGDTPSQLCVPLPFQWPILWTCVSAVSHSYWASSSTLDDCCINLRTTATAIWRFHTAWRTVKFWYQLCWRSPPHKGLRHSEHSIQYKYSLPVHRPHPTCYS